MVEAHGDGDADDGIEQEDPEVLFGQSLSAAVEGRIEDRQQDESGDEESLEAEQEAADGRRAGVR